MSEVAEFVVDEEFEDDNLIHFAQRMRKKLVTKLAEGGVIPEDPKEQMLMLQALGDMSHTALTNKRIKTAKESAKSDRETAIMVAKIAGQLQGRDIFSTVDGVEIALGNSGIPILDKKEIAGIEVEDYILEQGKKDLDMDTFFAQNA